MIVAPPTDTEEARIALLNALHLLDSPAEDIFDRITRLASQLLKVPIVAVSLIDRDRQWFKSSVGLDVSETPRDYAFCAHAIHEKSPLIISDALDDIRFHDNPLVVGGPNIRFYAGAPLFSAAGIPLGTLCVIDRIPRVLSEAEIQSLKDLAELVQHEIIHREASGLSMAIEEYNVQLENYREQTEAEHLLASDIFSRFTQLSLPPIPGIHTFTSPFSSFNGDLLLMAPRPGEGFNALIADITGHGLPAALGTMPIAEIFFKASAEGYGVGDIAREMNKAFRAQMPEYLLCAAVLISVVDSGRRLQIWPGGIPPIIIFDKSGQIKSLLPSSHMPLGALSNTEFENEIINIKFEGGERLLCYTDGVTEAEDVDGKQFGEDRLFELIAGRASGQDIVESIGAALSQHVDSVGLSDDVTVFCLDTQCYTGYNAEAIAAGANESTFQWKSEVQLCPAQLITEVPLALLLDTLPEHPVIRAARADISMIIGELFNNALDHGLLGLNSDIKEEEDGILRYYEVRQERLKALIDGSITLRLSCNVTHGAGEFEIYCEDSGPGFDFHAAMAATQDDDRHSGRGLRIIQQVGKQITFKNEIGSAIEVRYDWPA